MDGLLINTKSGTGRVIKNNMNTRWVLFTKHTIYKINIFVFVHNHWIISKYVLVTRYLHLVVETSLTKLNPTGKQY